jgi:hypothetical protein
MPNLLLPRQSVLLDLVPLYLFIFVFPFSRTIFNIFSLALSEQSCFSSLFSGAAEVLPFVESDLKKIAARVIEKAKGTCTSKSVNHHLLLTNSMLSKID